MFKSVKLKLTIINITVVGIILLFFLSGIYLLMKQTTQRQSEQLLRSVAIEVRRMGLRSNIPSQLRRTGNLYYMGSFYYVRFDSDGKIIDKSLELPFPID